MVKRIKKLTKKTPKSPRFTDTYPGDSDDDDEEKKPVVKKVSKSQGDVETGPRESEDSDTEDTLRAMGFLNDKSLELGKNGEGLVFKKGIYRGKKYHMLQHLIRTILKKC